MAKKYRVTPMKRAVSSVLSWFGRRGIGPAWVLTTIGHKTGERHQVAVSPIEHGEATYLVAPYGAVGWVRNVRAGGEAKLRRGKEEAVITLEEVEGDEAAGVVAAYYRREAFSRQFMDVPADPTVEDFAARAEQFPAFRVRRL